MRPPIAEQRNDEPGSNPSATETSSSQEERPPLAGKWLLELVRDRLGGTSFQPRRYSGLTLSARGGASWSDGCNTHSGSYSVKGQELQIIRGGSTLRGCDGFEPEDVHYDRVMHFELDAHTLTLETARQTYVLERFPYSALSEHAWSLYEIMDRATGKRSNVDRFRGEYRHLLINFENDERFRFTDLDLEEFTGTLEVDGNAIALMHYDAPSLARIQSRPVEFARLEDGYRDYEETDNLYPKTLAQTIEWSEVTSYRVHDATIDVAGQRLQGELLELHSETHVYVFTSR